MSCAGVNCWRSLEVIHNLPSGPNARRWPKWPLAGHLGHLAPDHREVLELAAAVLVERQLRARHGRAAVPPSPGSE